MNEQGAVLFFNEEERVWELVTMDVDTPQGVGCGSGRAQGSGGRRLGDRRAVQDVPEGGGITEGLVHGLWAKEERSVDSAFAPCWSQGNDPRPTLTRPASGEVRAMQDGLEGVPGTSEVCRPGLPGHGSNSHLGKARFWGTNSPPLLTYLAIRNTKLLQWRYYLEPRLINSPDPLTCLVSLGLP